MYLIFLIWSRCHLATSSPFIFFQVAAYTAVNRRFFLCSAPSPHPENVTPSILPRHPLLTYFLSLLSLHYFYIYSLVARVFFHHRHYVDILHLFIPLHRAYIVLFPTFFLSPLDTCLYAALCFANACSNIKKYSKQKSLRGGNIERFHKRVSSAVFKVVFVIHHIFLGQTYNLCLQQLAIM